MRQRNANTEPNRAVRNHVQSTDRTQCLFEFPDEKMTTMRARYAQRRKYRNGRDILRRLFDAKNEVAIRASE
jgi:hypothetical protein